MDEWLDFLWRSWLSMVPSASGKEASNTAHLEALCQYLQQHLAVRSVLVGYAVTLVDVAAWMSLKGRQAPP